MSGMRLAAPVAVCLLVGIGTATAQTAEERGRVDESSAARAADELYAVVREAVGAAGGDLTRESVHLAVGFSTGHFGTDPLQAEGARLTARLLADRLLVPGDRVSIFAWELGIWDHASQNTWGLGVDDLSNSIVRRIMDILPLSAVRQSPGGHDTELAIVQALDRLSSENNVVLVLLTNSAASVKGQPDQVLIGQNDPRYRDWLARVHRAPGVNRAGASCILTYRVELPDGRIVGRTAEAIVVVSNPFSGTPLAEPRPDRVVRTAEPSAPEAPSESPPKTQPESSSPPSWLATMIALVIGIAFVVGIAVAFLRRAREGLTLIVEDRYVESGGKEGQGVLRITGDGAGVEGALLRPGMPPVELFQIKCLEPRKLQVKRTDDVKSWRVNRMPVQGSEYRISEEGTYEIEYEVQINEHGVPTSKTDKLKIEAQRR